MAKIRLDQLLANNGLVASRSQAESYIKLGLVKVDGRVVTAPETLVDTTATPEVSAEQYVSRAGLKLASVAAALKLDFRGQIVMDVGSSTGGFTDYALKHGATRVIAVDSGTDQLHPSLVSHQQIDLHERTDIRDFIPELTPSIIIIDVSFISLREILPHITRISNKKTLVVAMVKPQFESTGSSKNRGVVKNEKMRRDILKDFELWARERFVILNKKDSAVAGTKGNQERFYLLKKS